MRSFKTFLSESYLTPNYEDKEKNPDADLTKGEMGMPKALHDFMWHLTAPNMHGHGVGPDFKEYHEGKVPLVEGFDEFVDALIAEAADHPLLATSKKLDLDHPHHPLNIVRRGIENENKLRAQHNADNEERIKSGDKTKPYASAVQRIDQGVDKALGGEAPSKDQIKDSVKHFRNFMAKEGGHAANNTLTLMGQNGKTASSKSAGRNTIGLSLAPHSIGTKDPTKKVEHTGQHWDTCPKASSECKAGCLGLTAGGNRQYPVDSLKAKVLRQRYVTEHPEHAARVLHHEISENEKWTGAHNSVHDKEGNVVGYKNKKTGKVQSESSESHDLVAHKLKSGEYHERPMEAGTRLNVTSDVTWHNMGDGKLIKQHPKTTFYDYTKNPKTAKAAREGKLPANYHIALSHTGDNHAESNSQDVIDHLRGGGVAAMVYQRGKDVPKAKRVKVVGSPEGKDEWHVADGDSDDNIDQRHAAAAEHHEGLAHAASKAGNHEEATKHMQIAKEYKERKRGVVSGLALKGVKNEDAGHFANKVDKDGTIWLHPQAKKTIPIKQS